MAGRTNAQIPEALATLADIMARDHQPGWEDEARLERFMKHKPPTFPGGYNLEGAVKWLEEVEIIFEAMRCVELGMLKLTNPFLEEVKECQKRDQKLMEKLVSINEGKEVDFGIDENGVVRYRGRVCVPDVPELKKMILEEGHR
ncbi:hypothetical protein A2U01_0044089, partial [Trifolium medium]|nr:hypothetical protein [Trifolium medium]